MIYRKIATFLCHSPLGFRARNRVRIFWTLQDISLQQNAESHRRHNSSNQRYFFLREATLLKSWKTESAESLSMLVRKLPMFEPAFQSTGRPAQTSGREIQQYVQVMDDLVACDSIPKHPSSGQVCA